MIENVDLKSNIEIYFRESDHKYTDQYDNQYTSVTTLVHKYVPHFDKEYWARKKAIESGVSVAEMLKRWQTINKHSTSKGSLTHNQIENSIKQVSIFKRPSEKITNRGVKIFSILDLEISEGSNIEYDKLVADLPKKYKGILPAIKFYVDKGFKIYSEVNVFHPYYLISGTIDILLVNDKKEFVIIDWKTNRKDIKFESGYYRKKGKVITNEWVKKNDKLLYPLSHLHNCDGMHYTMQLSLYAILVETFGFKLKALLLFHIRDNYELNEYGMPITNDIGMYIQKGDDKNIKAYNIRYLKREADVLIRTYYKDRKLELNQQKLDL